MPILKAGIWNSMKHKLKTNSRGFTFIEVIIAMTVVAIGLTALIRLQLLSINATSKGQLDTKVALLAQEKMLSATLAIEANDNPVQSGTEYFNELPLNWQTSLKDISNTFDLGNDISKMKQLQVTINWKQANTKRHYDIIRYIQSD